MKTLFFLTASFLIISCNSSTTKNALPKEEKRNNIFPFYSENVKDTFSIFIHLPTSYKTESNKQYKVFYVLDANYYFDTLVYLLNKIKIENTILVGVGYKDIETMDSLRDRDYTYQKALPQDSFHVSGGGAEKFLSFFKYELVPYIDKNYPADTSIRTLMGHSLGGYFALYALYEEILNKKNIFKNYIAASPYIGYCNGALIKQFENISSYDNVNRITLFLTVGGKEDEEAGCLFKFNSFVHLLSGSSFKNIKVKSEVYPTFEHMQTSVPTFEKALQEIK